MFNLSSRLLSMSTDGQARAAAAAKWSSSLGVIFLIFPRDDDNAKTQCAILPATEGSILLNLEFHFVQKERHVTRNCIALAFVAKRRRIS